MACTVSAGNSIDVSPSETASFVFFGSSSGSLTSSSTLRVSVCVSTGVACANSITLGATIIVSSDTNISPLSIDLIEMTCGVSFSSKSKRTAKFPSWPTLIVSTTVSSTRISKVEPGYADPATSAVPSSSTLAVSNDGG